MHLEPMHAILYSKYGTPEALQLKEIERPFPKDDEVLIKIYAASVNSWDWDLLTGKPYMYRILSGIFKPKLKILGCDIAGKVESVGKAITKFKAGDEVFGDLSAAKWGGFAEYVCAPENAISLKPENMTFNQAAATPQAAVLAMQSLLDKKQLKQGDKVLFNGAGGGVGTFGLQIAKSLGAEVTCVDSREKLDLLYKLGADHVIDYKKEDFTKNGKQYDLIVDVTMQRSLFKYLKSLLPGGVLAVVGGKIPYLYQLLFPGPLISLFGTKKMGIVMHQANKHLELIKELFESGKVVPVIDKIFILSEVPIALKHFGEAKFIGKIVISIFQNDADL